jgi:P27 family predicted phage terminase small subunit
MPAGRPAKPTIIKEREGNPGKRKVNRAEPKPRGGDPTPPKSLAPDALKHWKRLVAAQADGVFKITDEMALAIHCETVADYWQACADVAAQGRYVSGSTGQLVQSPASKAKNELARLMLSQIVRLGLDPIARQALHAPEEGKADDMFDGLIN